MAFQLDFTSPAFRADPYAAYRRLREEAPVYHAHESGREIWILSRYEDVATLLRDPRASVDRAFQPKPVPVDPNEDPASVHPLARALRVLSRVMLFRDPPDHTRLRGLVSKAFTPRVAEALRPRILKRVDELLDARANDGEMDLIHDFATPLPLLVIAELLGVPTEEYPSLKRWSDDLALMLDGTVAAGAIARAVPSAMEFIAFLREVVAARRRAPREDLLSGLLAAQAQAPGADLTEDEILGTAVILLGAGHETTTNLIGNGMLALLRHPSERVRLARDGSLLPSAVEEILRFDSPVQATSRTFPEPVLVGGHEIPAGREIGLLLGAANRDPAQFVDPERFDVGRAENRHLSFGHGIHFCLGAGLARVEAEVALGALLARHPKLTLAADTLVWRPGFLLRGVESLRVRF